MGPVMESSPLPSPGSGSSLCPTAVESLHLTSGGGFNTAPGSDSDGDAALAEQLATRACHLALLPSGNDTEALASSSRSSSSSQSLMPEPVAPLNAKNDAQPRINGISPRVASRTDHTEDAEYQPVSGEAAMTPVAPITCPSSSSRVAAALAMVVSENHEEEATVTEADNDPSSDVVAMTNLPDLPNEVLLQILGYLDVCDLLSTSRTSHRLRNLSLAPILHAYRLRHTKAILPPMLWSPFRPSLADLIRRSIFLTNTTVVSRKLARSLVCIRLSRRLAARPSPEALVARSVLPPECLPNRKAAVAPGLVAKKKAIERERVKDGLRRWIERVWTGEVRERSEGVKQWEERVGVGRVWRMTKFWERVGTGGAAGQHR